MSNYGYGQNYSDVGGINFEPGINDEVVMTSFELVDVSTTNYNGKVLDVSWERKGSTITSRIFPVDETKISPRGTESKEEAVAKAYGDLNSNVKHLVGAFQHVTENKESYDEAVKAATSFESFIEIAKKFLPNDYQQYVGKLIVGYDKNGYLKAPTALWVTGHYWVVDGSDKTIKINPKYLKLTPPVQSQPATSAMPTDEDVSW